MASSASKFQRGCFGGGISEAQLREGAAASRASSPSVVAKSGLVDRGGEDDLPPLKEDLGKSAPTPWASATTTTLPPLEDVEGAAGETLKMENVDRATRWNTFVLAGSMKKTLAC